MTPKIRKRCEKIEAEQRAMAVLICPDCGDDLEPDPWSDTSPFYDLKCYSCGFYAADGVSGHRRTYYYRNPSCKCCGLKFEDKFTGTYCGMCDSWVRRLIKKLFGL